MEIELEIGDNLRLSILNVINSCNEINDKCEYPQVNPGDEVMNAFGINFVELMKQDPEMKNLRIIIEKD